MSGMVFMDYGRVGETVWRRSCRHPGEGWMVMAAARPVADAVAQGDGTWLEPALPDLALGEAENVVGMFPVSYARVFELLGVGDII